MLNSVVWLQKWSANFRCHFQEHSSGCKEGGNGWYAISRIEQVKGAELR